MPVSQRKLTAYVYTEVDVRRETHSVKWLVAAILGSPKFNRDPTIVVVVDEKGVVQGRSAFGEVSEELKRRADTDFPD